MGTSTNAVKPVVFISPAYADITFAPFGLLVLAHTVNVGEHTDV